MTEKSTEDLREMCVIFLSQLFGILQVTSSSPHFTALSLKTSRQSQAEIAFMWIEIV